MKSPHLIKAAGKSDTGLKRGRNEDGYKILIPATHSQQASNGSLFMVADGMGGMGGGDLASRSALDEIARQFYARPRPSSDTVSNLSVAINAANTFVRKQASTINRDYIGSTVAGVVLTPDRKALVFNVGDSRIYRCRRNFIELLSRDQSVNAQQVEAGKVLADTERINNNLTAFIGQPIPLEPQIQRHEVRSGDIFVICTDGLWSLLEANEIAEIVEGNSPEKATDNLIAAARKRGAPDNVTAVIVQIDPPHRRSRAVPVIALLLFGAALIVSTLLLTSNQSSTTNATTNAATVAGSSMSATAVTQLTITDTTAISGAVIALLPGQTLVQTHTLMLSPSTTSTVTEAQVLEMTSTYLQSQAIAPASPSVTPRAVVIPLTPPTDPATYSRAVASTQTPSPTYTATVTVPPSLTLTSTTTLEPTVTLNPALATQDISTSPTSTSIAPVPEHARVLVNSAILDYAEQQSVTLQVEVTGWQEESLQIQIVPAGSQINVINALLSDFGQGWIPVHVTAPTGQQFTCWLLQQTLSLTLPQIPQIIAIAEVNIRNGDSADYEIITALHPGEYLPVIDRGPTGWYQLRLPDGRYGWITSSDQNVYLWGNPMDNRD